MDTQKIARENVDTRFALWVCRNLKKYAHVSRHLETMGFTLHKARTSSRAQTVLTHHHYDFVLIEFGTTGPETLHLCTSAHRSNPNTTVIVLMDRPKLGLEEQLFDCGVCDVVVGPQCSNMALMSRIKARLRNTRPRLTKTGTIRMNGAIVDFARREVWREGTVHRLPGILADLLRYFVDNADHVVSRKELQESCIWADSICTPAEEGGNTFDVNVGKLRKIIEADPANPQIIKSVRGVGWKLASELQ